MHSSDEPIALPPNFESEAFADVIHEAMLESGVAPAGNSYFIYTFEVALKQDKPFPGLPAVMKEVVNFAIFLDPSAEGRISAPKVAIAVKTGRLITDDEMFGLMQELAKSLDKHHIGTYTVRLAHTGEFRPEPVEPEQPTPEV